MGRYSFFINGAVDVLAPSQFSSVRYVYAGDFDDGNSSDSVDGESVVDDNDDSDWEEEAGLENADIEDFKLVEQEQEQEELPSESLIQPESQAQTLEMSPFAFPTNNWGFNYQMDPGLFWVSNYSDFQPKFRTLFMPNYNNFVDHVAARINTLTAGVAENTRVNAHLNARIDSTNSELYRLDGVNKSLITAVSSRVENLNARIDSTNAYVYNTLAPNLSNNVKQLNARIDSTNNFTYGLEAEDKQINKRIDSTNNFTYDLQAEDKQINKRIDSTNNFAYVLESADKQINRRIDSTNDFTFLLESADKQINRRIDSTNDFTYILESEDKQINRRIDSTNSEVYRIDAKHVEKTNHLDSRINSTNSDVLGAYNAISTLNSLISNIDMFTELRKWFGVNDYTNNHGEADGAFTKLMKTQNKNLLSAINSVSGKIKDYSTQFTVLNASTLLNGTKIDSFAKKNDENLTFLLAAIGTLKNYDDSSLKASVNNVGSKIKDYTTQLNAIKTAVDSVKSNMKDYTGALNSVSLSTVANGTKIDSFAKKNDENLTFLLAAIGSIKTYDDTSFKEHMTQRFKDYLYVHSTGYEVGINSQDGVFTKLIKGQFTRLISELNRIFTLQIQKFDQIKTAVTNLDQNIADQFELLFGWISLEIEWYTEMNKSLLASVENQNFIAELLGFTNDWLSIIDGNIQTSLTYLETITNWLKQIYEKPVGGGSIINPAPEGTNFWDVLKSLVDGLAGVATAIIGLVDDLIDKLISLIIPENKNIFSEKISQFTGKFDTKFSAITKISTEFKNVYGQPKNINSIQINIFDQNLKLIPDMFAENFNWLRGMLSAFMYLSTLVTCYKRIVGSGDVIE